MKLDNVEVLVGDHVFDVAWGGGVVTNFMADGKLFGVNFGSKKFYYDANGISQNGNKTLYWKNPITKVLPTKDDAKWALYSKLCDANATALGLV